MTRWNDLRAQMVSELRPVKQEADHMVLVSRIDTLSVVIHVRHADAAVELRARVGLEAAMAPRAALAYNEGTWIGALALDEGQLALRYAIPVAALTFDVLRSCLEYLAREAARLSLRAQGTRQPPQVFSYMAE